MNVVHEATGTVVMDDFDCLPLTEWKVIDCAKRYALRFDGLSRSFLVRGNRVLRVRPMCEPKSDVDGREAVAEWRSRLHPSMADCVVEVLR